MMSRWGNNNDHDGIIMLSIMHSYHGFISIPMSPERGNALFHVAGYALGQAGEGAVCVDVK